MRLVITDTGMLWKHDNPILEQFKDIVLVVCLNGKPVADKYECFVVTNDDSDENSGHYTTDDRRLTALASVGIKLNRELRYHDDIVFLTDNDPSTLFPYYVLKNLNEYNHLHLITVSPWDFDGLRKKQFYYQLLSDLSPLSSLLLYDSNQARKACGETTTIGNLYGYIRTFFESNLIRILNGIYDKQYSETYFDFSSMSYIPIHEGFGKVIKNKPTVPSDEIQFPVYRSLSMLGLVLPPSYPDTEKWVKERIEQLTPRTDGKRICNELREQRILLAEANHIPFESEECPSVGPCGGTCQKCDKEARYLYLQMQKIPQDKRVYPQFEPQNPLRDLMHHSPDAEKPGEGFRSMEKE